MTLVALLVWVGPALIGAATGLYHGRRPAHSVKDFAKDVGLMLIIAGPVIFMLHMVWLGAFMMADGGVAALGRWSAYWTVLTALIWVPLMVICYIIAAMRSRA